MNKPRTLLLALLAIAISVSAPLTASAQTQSQLKHRQDTKNQWRNLGIGSAAVGVYGLLKHDNTLTFLGAAGALYSANRYEQDRRSQGSMQRARARMFSRGYFYRNGHKYVRKTVYKDGQKYYRFVRA